MRSTWLAVLASLIVAPAALPGWAHADEPAATISPTPPPTSSAPTSPAPLDAHAAPATRPLRLGAIPSALQTEEGQLLLRSYRSARVERRTGWALTGVGLSAMAAGVAVLAYGLEYGLYNQIFDVVLSGSLSLAVGAALAITGATLSVHGQDRLTEAEWRLRGLVVVPMVVPLRDGVAAGARFRF